MVAKKSIPRGESSNSEGVSGGEELRSVDDSDNLVGWLVLKAITDWDMFRFLLLSVLFCGGGDEKFDAQSIPED